MLTLNFDLELKIYIMTSKDKLILFIRISKITIDSTNKNLRQYL